MFVNSEVFRKRGFEGNIPLPGAQTHLTREKVTADQHAQTLMHVCTDAD